jgi:hypothetical protein
VRHSRPCSERRCSRRSRRSRACQRPTTNRWSRGAVERVVAKLRRLRSSRAGALSSTISTPAPRERAPGQISTRIALRWVSLYTTRIPRSGSSTAPDRRNGRLGVRHEQAAAPPDEVVLHVDDDKCGASRSTRTSAGSHTRELDRAVHATNGPETSASFGQLPDAADERRHAMRAPRRRVRHIPPEATVAGSIALAQTIRVCTTDASTNRHTPIMRSTRRVLIRLCGHPLRGGSGPRSFATKVISGFR